jgi:uncharacterized protein YfaT (DUF1175 family)
VNIARLWLAVTVLVASSALPIEVVPLSGLDDQRAFRSWFTFLAEVQAYATPAPEINDCGALVRYAYREALRKHDARWATEIALPLVPSLPDVRVSRYPARFRVSPREWAEFADAKTLQRWNAFPVTRDVGRAQPGDLLFYRQLSQRMPFHVMIYVGRSQIEPGATRWIVYHTGPSQESKGEIRRVSVAELMHHPSPQWRPLEGNPNFLGVYRWNLLRSLQ